MKKEYSTMFDKLAPPKSDDELLRAVLSGKADDPMKKRKFRFKPLIAAAAIVITSLVSLLTVNAATKGAVVKFFMRGESIEGEYYDYVDKKGYRHISFGTTLPIYEENYAVIYDVDAPQDKAVRVITDDTDKDFMDKLRRYRKAIDDFWDAREAWCKEHNVTPKDIADTDFNDFDLPYPDPEDFGVACKDNELCLFNLGFVEENGLWESYQGSIGGKFMNSGIAKGLPSGVGDDDAGCIYDWENKTKTFRESFYYYVGKE